MCHTQSLCWAEKSLWFWLGPLLPAFCWCSALHWGASPCCGTHQPTTASGCVSWLSSTQQHGGADAQLCGHTPCTVTQAEGKVPLQPEHWCLQPAKQAIVLREQIINKKMPSSIGPSRPPNSIVLCFKVWEYVVNNKNNLHWSYYPSLSYKYFPTVANTTALKYCAVNWNCRAILPLGFASDPSFSLSRL